MKKNKKEKVNLLQKPSPALLKTILTYFILFIVLALCLYILIYRYVNNFCPRQELVCQNSTPIPAPEVAHVPVPEVAPVPVPENVLLQNEINAQNNRLVQVEGQLTQWQAIPTISHQLLAMEILREVLEGHLPLSTFSLYLQKNPEPWAPPILSSISIIKESKTYAQLQASLVLSLQPPSLWQRIKHILKSIVRVRKLDETGHYVEGHFDDIAKALREHNIGQALEFFNKLPLQEQAQLALWKQEAHDRWTLETIKQKMLLDLVGS